MECLDYCCRLRYCSVIMKNILSQVRSPKNLPWVVLVLLSGLSALYIFSAAAPSRPSGNPGPIPVSTPIISQAINDQQIIIYRPSLTSYSISYFPQTEEYLISITGAPFSKYLEEAEAAFLESMEITIEAACKLNVTVSTPFFANPAQSGKLYPLSFCGTVPVSTISPAL